MLLWGDIPMGEFPANLETGRHGRPCYVVGPYDDVPKQNLIIVPKLAFVRGFTLLGLSTMTVRFKNAILA